MKRQNLVAKYSRRFNKPAVHIDKKRAAKRGYQKHAKKYQF